MNETNTKFLPNGKHGDLFFTIEGSLYQGANYIVLGFQSEIFYVKIDESPCKDIQRSNCSNYCQNLILKVPVILD